MILNQIMKKFILSFFCIDSQSQTLLKQLHFDLIKKILDNKIKVLFIEIHSYYDKDEKDDYEEYIKKSYKIMIVFHKLLKMKIKWINFYLFLKTKKLEIFSVLIWKKKK